MRELKERGLTQADLARNCGVTPQAVARVKNVSSRRLQSIIAELLGVPAHEIWPDRYSIADLPPEIQNAIAREEARRRAA